MLTLAAVKMRSLWRARSQLGEQLLPSRERFYSSNIR